jgi:hypothetical protein
MKWYLFLFAVALATQLPAQNWPLKQATNDRKKTGKPFTRLSAFTLGSTNMKTQNGTYAQLQLNNAFIKKVMTERPETMQIGIPLNTGKTIDCELIKVSPGTVRFTENNNKLISGASIPVLYQGVVTGKQEKNNVVLTVNNEYVSLLAVTGDETIQITKADEPDTYRLYNSADIQFPSLPLSCGTKDNSPRQTARDISAAGALPVQNSVQDKCVFVFFECFDSLYQWRGKSQQATINYVYELFNLVMAGYLNDSIKVQISAINIWTKDDPYRQPNRETALDDLCFYYKDNFWGNLCIGLDYGTKGRAGLAARIGKVKALVPNSCAVYRESDSTGALAYCDQNYGGSYQNFPTGPNVTQGQLYQVMHEMGHLLGSHHTQWCGWLLSQNPSVYGAIDNCAPVEPVTKGGDSCAPGPPPPASGGSLMSYCNSAPAFINYNNGFGALPGNTVRTFIANNQCIPLCINCPGNTGSLQGNPPGSEQFLTKAALPAGIKMSHSNATVSVDNKKETQ